MKLNRSINSSISHIVFQNLAATLVKQNTYVTSDLCQTVIENVIYSHQSLSTYCFEWPTKSLVKDNSKHYRRCTEVQHETCPTSKGDQPNSKK